MEQFLVVAITVAVFAFIVSRVRKSRKSGDITPPKRDDDRDIK